MNNLFQISKVVLSTKYQSKYHVRDVCFIFLLHNFVNFSRAVAYIIADSIEFNAGGAVDELAADAASDAKIAIDSNSKKRRRNEPQKVKNFF